VDIYLSRVIEGQRCAVRKTWCSCQSDTELW